MSWSGFKKNVGRATTQVMMKTGQVEKTTDREYEVEERRYRTLEAASLRLQKEAKGYLDSLRAMTASQMRIAETIDAFYGDSGAKDGVSRSYKQAVEDLDAETVKALDGPYRTTVLEPINRFCAYFPDINECIKKRQHKMLDYDSLRSKVKKLTEKPDKDPGKLPRTEKETEMVSLKSFASPFFHLHTHTPSPTKQPSRTSTSTGHTQSSGSSTTGKDSQPDLDLSVPSPPKALQRPEIEKLRRAERLERAKSMSLTRSPSLSSRGTGLKSLGLALGAAPDELLLTRSASAIPTSPTHANGFSDEEENSSRRLPRTPTRKSVSRSFGDGASTPPTISVTEHSDEIGSNNNNDKNHYQRSGANQNQNQKLGNSYALKTPFFNPSELDDIMQPFKQEFMQRQADELMQAKAAYEQLNDQLTSELPQLIDLRVPYLDPSFEALVKIQLRFCAEAYSRMAQVQQYLDASTRDQYASGDLDARVEDVLGQIRELSIAGTV